MRVNRYDFLCRFDLVGARERHCVVAVTTRCVRIQCSFGESNSQASNSRSVPGQHQFDRKMASLCGRVIFQASRPSIQYTSVRFAKKVIPDAMELATGIEKRELLARQAGNDDPFNMKGYKRGPGTKEEPNLVPSAFDSRLVGCVCEEDATSIAWMWLHEGTPRRCECGHWFKLVKKPPL